MYRVALFYQMANFYIECKQNTHIERLLLVKEENSASIKLLRDTHDQDISDMMRRLTVEYESKLATEKDQVLKLKNENSDLTKEICRMKKLVLDMVCSHTLMIAADIF